MATIPSTIAPEGRSVAAGNVGRPERSRDKAGWIDDHLSAWLLKLVETVTRYALELDLQHSGGAPFTVRRETDVTNYRVEGVGADVFTQLFLVEVAHSRDCVARNLQAPVADWWNEIAECIYPRSRRPFC